ncbi:Hypothetical protein FKW44_017672, partial [Caligus rogercresseyi]
FPKRYANSPILHNLILSLNLVDTLNVLKNKDNISWCSGNRSSRIDYALLSPLLFSKLKSAQYLPEPSSDHRIIELLFHHASSPNKFYLPKWILHEPEFSCSLNSNL